MLANVLGQASKNPKLIGVLLERAAKDPLLFAEAAAALNLATYQRAVADLKALIGKSEKEQDFQALLTAHPWMFGSEYSQLLDRRRWTRDENQDFVLRRTSDGYIELIEIKTPLNGKALFNHDQFHPRDVLDEVVPCHVLRGLVLEPQRSPADLHVEYGRLVLQLYARTASISRRTFVCPLA